MSMRDWIRQVRADFAGHPPEAGPDLELARAMKAIGLLPDTPEPGAGEVPE
jgi:hypothetical protein